MQRLRIQDWSLGKVARAMNGRLTGQTIGMVSPRLVTTDTRAIEGGEIFFALRGERFDGHDFLEDAVDAGVCAVVVDDESAIPSGRAAAIIVDDTIEALGRLGQALFREATQEGARAVAVTGSNGKTTTKELLATLWSTVGEVWATPGNLNNHIGVPLTLCAMPADCDHLIVEMGANHGGEIEELIKLAPASHRIITSIGSAHLEGFGSLAGVRKAKSEIFGSSSRATTAIVPHGEREHVIPKKFTGHVITFGDQPEADARIVEARTTTVDGRIGTQVVIDAARRKWHLSLPLVGAYNAWNLAAALSTLLSEGVDVDEGELNAALASLELPGGRLRVVEIDELQILNDAYNANPSSMRASFGAFRDWCSGDEIPGDAVAVIGDMFELGEVADREHQSLALWLAEQPGLSALVFVGQYGPAMAEAASGRRVDQVLDCSDLDEVAQWLAERGPTRVFLKGSRGNKLERLLERLKAKSQNVMS